MGKERGREAAVGGGERDKEGARGCPYLLFNVRTLCGRRQGGQRESRGDKEKKKGEEQAGSNQFVWCVKR